MRDFYRESQKYFPSPHLLRKMAETISADLEEMAVIAATVKEGKERWNKNKEGPQLYYLGSLLYEFYLIVEESMLAVARTIDRWVPCTLDWHERLLKQMRRSLPELRPAVISPSALVLLENYLYFYLSFQRRRSSISPQKVEKLAEELETVFPQVSRELHLFCRMFGSTNKIHSKNFSETS